jgi:hypothetical protein
MFNPIKKRAGREPGAVILQPCLDEVGRLTKVSDIDLHPTWEVSATDGFILRLVAGKIHIVQEPVCREKQMVILSIGEAEKLRELLTSAIMAAGGKAGT